MNDELDYIDADEVASMVDNVERRINADSAQTLAAATAAVALPTSLQTTGAAFDRPDTSTFCGVSGKKQLREVSTLVDRLIFSICFYVMNNFFVSDYTSWRSNWPIVETKTQVSLPRPFQPNRRRRVDELPHRRPFYVNDCAKCRVVSCSWNHESATGTICWTKSEMIF